MSTNVVTPPFNIWTDLDGQPLENGMIWVGVANMDAPSNPVAVFWDAALTIPVALPIRTVNGYPSRDGSPGVFFVDGDYSLKVTTAVGVPVYSAPARIDTTVTDVVISLGESLIVESGGTVDLEDGSVLNIGDATGIGVDVTLASNARIVGNIVPDTAGSQELGSNTRDWFAHLSGARVTGDILADTAGSMGIGTDTFPAGETVTQTLRADDVTVYRTAQPASSSDYAGLAKLNARGTLLAACRQIGCAVSGYPDGNSALLEAASASKDGPYNVSGFTATTDAYGVKVRVNFTVPIPLDAKVCVTAEYVDGTGELPSAVNIGFPVIVERATGSVSIRMVPSSSSFGVLFPFSLEVWGTPSVTGASGIVSPIA